MKLIDKDILVEKIKEWTKLLMSEINQKGTTQIDKLFLGGRIVELQELKNFLDTLEVKGPYEQCVQYDSIKSGIQAHADTYSFNIESELFNQLTKEQQKLWRKEIEQAVISGGEIGVELTRDARYKENLEIKEMDLEKSISDWLFEGLPNDEEKIDYIKETAEHFFELGLNAQKGE